MIWLIGNKGMLGTQMEKFLLKEKMGFYASDKEADITSIKCLEDFINNKKIRYIINCSAYTAVDKAETEQEPAYRINAEGVENIAKIAKKLNAVLIHFSTDYVFDGSKKSPYSENDETLPASVYGKTKLQGELLLKKITEKYFIFRISWLYGIYGPNFVKTMVRLFNEKNELNVVEDQKGSPTYCSVLAKNIISLLKEENTRYGTYHYSDEGTISWYDFANKIQELAFKNGFTKKKIPIHPIPAERYPLPAKRPLNSAFDKAKVKSELNFTMNKWEDNLEAYFQELKV